MRHCYVVVVIVSGSRGGVDGELDREAEDERRRGDLWGHFREGVDMRIVYKSRCEVMGMGWVVVGLIEAELVRDGGASARLIVGVGGKWWI